MSSDSENDNSPALRRIGGFTGSSQDEMNIVDVCASRALFDQVNDFLFWSHNKRTSFEFDLQHQFIIRAAYNIHLYTLSDIVIS